MYQAINRIRTSLFALIVLFLITTPSAYSQEMTFRSTEDGSIAMMAIPGGLVLVEGEEEARIARRIVPAPSNSDAPDLKEGDLIIFLNGARITSTAQFNTLYEEIATDEEVKLGIQRGENKMIRVFNKPEMQDDYSSDDGGRVMRFEMNGPQGGNMEGLTNTNLWPAGFIVGEKEGGVVIGASMPIPNKAEALSALKEGDIITTVDGFQIESVEQLLAIYEKMAVGDDVAVAFQRGKETENIKFKKPEPPQMKMRVQRN